MNTIEEAPAPIVLQIPEGLEPATAVSLKQSFDEYFEQADEWRSKALSINVTSPDQTEDIKFAREARLALKAIRVNAGKVRKALKEDSLKKGRAIDGIYNILAFAVEPLEKHLLEQEQYVQRIEQERISALVDGRKAELEALGASPGLFQLDVMTDEQFSDLVESIEISNKAKAEAAEKAEADRAAAEKKAAAEREAQRVENERLKKERDALEVIRKADAEKVAKAEAARLEAEKEAADLRADALLQQQAQAAFDAKEIADELAKGAAPDREKLCEFADQVGRLTVPECTTDEGKEVAADVAKKVSAFSRWIKDQANQV